MHRTDEDDLTRNIIALAGEYGRVQSDWFSESGAVPGHTDDTAAIQSAINAAGSAGVCAR